MLPILQDLVTYEGRCPNSAPYIINIPINDVPGHMRGKRCPLNAGNDNSGTYRDHANCSHNQYCFAGKYRFNQPARANARLNLRYNCKLSRF